MAVLFFHTQIINYNYLYAINAWLLLYLNGFVLIGQWVVCQ